MYCFGKTRRLLKKQDFDQVFQQAKKIVSSEFVLLYRDNEAGHARLGLALSKKIIAKAHDRNRIKRIVRETFRIRHLPSVDIIILARNGITSVENSMVGAKLEKAWDRLSVLCKK